MRALGPVSAERGFAPHRARDDTRAHYPKKLIQPLTNTPKLTDMKPTSASVTSYHTLGPGQVIGLFLARLLACLLRLRARGETAAPPHIAPMVSAADAIVHAYICNLAAGRLKSAGYSYAADALRTARADNASPADAEPTSPEALIARLEDTIATFHQAQALSVYFARLVFCALCMITVDEGTAIRPHSALRAPSRSRRFTGFTLIARSPHKRWRKSSSTPSPMGRGPPDFSPTIPNLFWDPCQSAGKMPGGSSQAWIPAFAGISG